MITKLEVEMMKEAYSIIYILENSLRVYITNKMKITYGLNWYVDGPRSEKLRQYNKSFSKLNFYELIPFLIIYPCISSLLPDKVTDYLKKLVFFRNKIAHNNCLSDNEMKSLTTYFNYIIKYIHN